MARWDPWSDLFNMQSEMSRWVNEALGSGQYLAPALGNGGRSAAAPVVYLPLDIRQRDQEFLVEASVPGFAPEDVEVTADQGVLTIRGEHKGGSQSGDESDGSYLRRERSHYSFVRQLTLPTDVKEEEISASFRNGVITIHLPRVEAPAPRRIPVSTGDVADAPKVLEAGVTKS